MAVKVANNEDLNGDDSISRRLVNVFEAWKRGPFMWRFVTLWKRILSSLRFRAQFINRFVHESKNEEAARAEQRKIFERELYGSRLLIY